jgi:4-hydroxy-tetrahydrodipicolinate reductase
MESIFDQLRVCMVGGARVVSSSEELFYPWDRHPDIASLLHDIALEHKSALLGTGVNPGFSMDTLALVATGVMRSVSSLQIERCVDAGRRRLPLQKKVGATLSVDEFESLKREGKIGHVGLVESLRFVARGLGWQLDHVGENLAPVVARKPVTSALGEIQPGQVAGIHHTASGIVNGREAIAMDLKMFVGAEQEFDAVHAEGDPPVDLIVRDGIFGDTATVASLVNAIPLVLSASPGLKTMLDIPIPRAFGTSP